MPRTLRKERQGSAGETMPRPQILNRNFFPRQNKRAFLHEQAAGANCNLRDGVNAVRSASARAYEAS